MGETTCFFTWLRLSRPSFSASNSQLDPVLAVVAAIAFAGIAIVFVALKKE